jgi:ABC-type transport system involved in multi-copper enzyme maturation permease subunit
MSQKLVPLWIIRLLIAGLVVLPIAICVILAVAALLGEMGEPPERSPLRSVALGVGIFWVVDLICLVLAQGLNSLANSDEDQ